MTETFAVPVADLATLPRRRLDADFHCVSGWTAVGLHWEGVAFAEFYRLRIEPTLRPGAVVTHVEFRGLDGFRSVITIEDALDDDVLLADHLDGEPLGNDHGAPLRLVSPAQYGYISTKHLCRIDVHTAAPTGGPRSFVLDVLLHSHPQGEGLGGGAPRDVARPRGPAVLPGRRDGDAAPQPTAVARLLRKHATTRHSSAGTGSLTGTPSAAVEVDKRPSVETGWIAIVRERETVTEPIADAAHSRYSSFVRGCLRRQVR